jgi:uncharacterized membrane protein
MNSTIPLLLAFGIGVVAGLRAMTAPAVTAWAAHLERLALSGTFLAFMGSKWTAAIFTLAAIGELVNDQLPNAPPRTQPGPLIARMVMGALCGACIMVGAGHLPWLGAVLGAVGTVAGTFSGYKTRVGLVQALHVPDFAIAIPEDLVAIGLGWLLVSRF